MLMEEKKLYEEGYEEYPRWWVDFENLFYIVYIGIGFVGMLSLQIAGMPLIALFYLACVLVMLGIVLRKHVCTNCYYYGKRCHCGWGILSSKLYKKGACGCNIGWKIAGLTWFLIAAIPIASMALILFLEWTTQTLNFLLAFIALTIINWVIHRRGCAHCKMRFICPGSAAKSRKKTFP